jgi:hypothetical protein
LAAGFHSIGLIIRDWFRIGFIWGSRPKLPILSISKGLVKHWHFRPILSQSALSGIGWLALDWKKGEYFTLGISRAQLPKQIRLYSLTSQDKHAADF